MAVNMRERLWNLVLVVGGAAALTGLAAMVSFLPRLGLVDDHFVVRAQVESRSTGAAVAIREIHALLGMPLVAVAALGIGLAWAGARRKLKVVTLGVAGVLTAWAADRSGAVLSSPELGNWIEAGRPLRTSVGDVPLASYLGHIAGGLGALLVIGGLWAVSHRLGPRDESPSVG